MRRLVSFLLFAAAVTAHAQVPRVRSDYMRVLLPFHTSLISGNGIWFVQWWFRNEGPAADVFPLAFSCGLPPPPGPEGPRVFMLARPSLPAATTLACLAGDALPSFPVPPNIPVVSTSSGAFLYVESSAASRIDIGGNIRWLSSTSSGGVTALHPIPEQAFVAGTRSVFPVPLVANRRYAIRVYALPETLQASPRVQLRIYDMQPSNVFIPNEELRATIPLELAVPAAHVQTCLNACDVPPIGYVPAVAQAFNLVVAPPPGRSSTLRVEIVPESESLRWWAVVSATDNATNEISLFEPADPSRNRSNL